MRRARKQIPCRKTLMNHLNISLLLSILICCGFTPVFAQQAEADSARYVFSASHVSIPKQIKDLKLVDVQSVPDGHDAMARFSNPPETMGPFLALDSSGREVLEERREEKKIHNAVLKLTTPSESYLREYARVIKAISATGFLADPKADGEFRFMAVPKRKDSPIAYAALMSGMRKLRGDESIPWTWKTYLYSVPGYFVKIHCTYPSQLWLDIGAIDVEFIQAINWNEVIPNEKQKPTK